MTIGTENQGMVNLEKCARSNTMPTWKSMSIAQASETYKYSYEHLRRLVASGKVIGEKIGSLWLVKVESLEEYIKDQEATGDGRMGPKGKR